MLYVVVFQVIFYTTIFNLTLLTHVWSSGTMFSWIDAHIARPSQLHSAGLTACLDFTFESSGVHKYSHLTEAVANKHVCCYLMWSQLGGALLHAYGAFRRYSYKWVLLNSSQTEDNKTFNSFWVTTVHKDAQLSGLLNLKKLTEIRKFHVSY